MSRLALDRRTFLRGMLGGTAISIGLPPLEAFFDANGNPIKHEEKPMPTIPEEDPAQQQYDNYVGYIKKCISKETDDEYRDQQVMQGVSRS